MPKSSAQAIGKAKTLDRPAARATKDARAPGARARAAGPSTNESPAADVALPPDSSVCRRDWQFVPGQAFMSAAILRAFARTKA